MAAAPEAGKVFPALEAPGEVETGETDAADLGPVVQYLVIRKDLREAMGWPLVCFVYFYITALPVQIEYAADFMNAELCTGKRCCAGLSRRRRGCVAQPRRPDHG